METYLVTIADCDDQDWDGMPQFALFRLSEDRLADVEADHLSLAQAELSITRADLPCDVAFYRMPLRPDDTLSASLEGLMGEMDFGDAAVLQAESAQVEKHACGHGFRYLRIYRGQLGEFSFLGEFDNIHGLVYTGTLAVQRVRELMALGAR
jgi:hypothetical protein